MTQNAGLTAETLLRHEPFVRAVVRGLLSDEARVQDVIQETWLRALRRPPRAGASLRAWLARVARNLAKDAHRRASRRAAREQAVARSASVESVEASYERLAAQREVVDAVLALEEPYKEVVLLCYYQDLATVEIAQRLGRSPATVRSQLSRARAILRSALDARFGGRPSAWASLVLPAAAKGRLLETIGRSWTATGVKGLVGALLVGAGAVVVVPRLLGPSEPAAVPGAMAAGPVAHPSEPPAGGVLARVGEPGAGAREPVEAKPQDGLDPAQRAGLGSRSVEELLALAVQTQRAIEKHLLTPDEGVVAEHSALLSRPHTGICRILRGNGTESRLAHAVAKRGGGTYWSFATQDHSYDAEPDLSFHFGRFDAGFNGIQLGLLLELGDIPLADLPEHGGTPPVGLSDEKRDAWRALWRDLTLADAAHDSRFREETRELRRSIAPSGTATTFLLRVFSPGEHDHVVAFRPLVLDEVGCTLAWRILATWPVSDRRGPSARGDEHRDVPPGPRWLDEMSLEDLLGFLELVRERAREDLLAVPQAVVDHYEEVVGQPATSFAQRAGFARILHRGRWNPLVGERGGGAYFSFLKQSNSYDEAPELSLESDRYSSGFAGRDTGLLLDLGEIPFDRLAGVMSGDPPIDSSERSREAWDFLWRVRATVQGSGDGARRSLGAADERRAAELGLTAPVPAIVGHTYLLRSVLFPAHDHLVAFTVVAGDAYGHTLAWRILRSWAVERTPGGR